MDGGERRMRMLTRTTAPPKARRRPRRLVEAFWNTVIRSACNLGVERVGAAAAGSRPRIVTSPIR